MNDVRQFLSLEAAVDDSESEDEYDEEEQDDFFQHDCEPIAGDKSRSHQLLLRETTRVEGDTEWDSLLDRARSRAQTYTPHLRSSLPNSEAFPSITMGEARLWRVAVKPGREEATAFLLMEKIIRAGEQDQGIKSIIGRVSRPGWIVVEANSASDVRELCQGVTDVFGKQIHVIEPEDGPSCLKEANLFTPATPSWIRLTKQPYRGDLAYVNEVGVGEADVLVVPRLKLQRRSSAGHAKRKRGSTISAQPGQKKSTRPEQALFDHEKVREIFGDKAVQRKNQTYVFKGNEYLDGYLWLQTDEYYPEAATPTPEELSLFQHSKSISKEFLQRTLEVMGAVSLRLGDRVKVAEGEAQGAFGVVQNIVGNEADVHLSSEDVQLTLPVKNLRKNIRIGDEVIVRAGPHAGVTGWVITSGDTVLVYDHKTAREVGPFLPVFINFIVSSHAIDFFEASFIMRPLSLDPGQSQARTRDNLKVQPDPNLRFVGRHVRVIGSGHGLKDYEGIVKSIEVDNYALVEISATMRQQRLPLSKLASRNDPTLTPLNVDGAATATNLESSGSRTIAIRPSSLPLVPSTPLPPALTGVLSPAWDPTSSSPDSSSSFPYNPWMESPLLAGKRIKVRFQGTKAVLRDPGWKSGDYEGRFGIWTGTEGSSAQVSVGLHSTLTVPEKYVRPVRPSIKGQNVIVIGDDHDLWKGEEFYVITFSAEQCIVRRRHGKIDPKDRLYLDTNTLAVVL
ncbi:hypothetical protein D9615_007593 [Tricholomella constricta]|uniref:Chromatin elongation factor SPT5 n=1 Tax=Tricholomella constricta TaxID=117010 RepID=A0A8H5H7Q5_9AGAR|nr:hypothetical protein D9615_007593 [Tricholomella constricta]